MMKKLHLSLFISALVLLVTVFLSAVDLSAQTPQFYNYNNGTSYNSFPFNQAAGKMIQTLVAPGEYTQPTPATAGNITKWYFRVSTGYPLGPATYTSFKVLFCQTALTTLPASLFTGAWDTVYQRASTTITGAADTWVELVLDHPFAYNPAQSLVIQIEQCSATGTIAGFSAQHTATAVMRRTYSTGGCPFTYGGQSLYVLNNGITVAPAIPPLTYPLVGCNYGTMPAYPSGTFGHASAVLGDTLYVTGSTSAAAGSTTVQRYAINTNIFSLGTVLPEAKTGHSLTKAGNSLFLIGGSASVTVGGTTCYKYTTAAGWTSIAPLPVALSGHVSVNWGDSVIFVIGGPWAAPSTNVYYYRVATNTWGTSTACLAGRRSAAIGIVGNKIIIAAGYNAGFFKNTQIGTIGADASTITWAAGPDVPLPGATTGSSRPGGTGVGTKFYFVPGEMTGGVSNTSDSIRVFDALTNTWEPTLIFGRGVTGSASNYWAAVTNWTSGTGKVKIFITGGALGTVFPGLCVAQVDACTITNINPIETPASYSLSQNYPNPFNPVTKISYALPKSGFVTMKVYDMLGREVVNLVSENKVAGNYSVDFNASSLTSGVYFYRLEVNGYVDTKKMMLVK